MEKILNKEEKQSFVSSEIDSNEEKEVLYTCVDKTTRLNAKP